MPISAHVSARPDDAAGVLAFGFVYARPIEDGHGRIHRYVIHHLLAQRAKPNSWLDTTASALASGCSVSFVRTTGRCRRGPANRNLST
jgi:hypothetical protein